MLLPNVALYLSLSSSEGLNRIEVVGLDVWHFIFLLINARVVVEAVDREEIEVSARGLVEVRVDKVTHPVIVDDIPKPAQEGAAEVTYETLGDLVQRFHDHTVAIPVHRVQAIVDVARLGVFCSRLVPNEEDIVERFVGGITVEQYSGECNDAERT
ncbi:hypothetical protein Tco_0635217 [Tanacetum coccineum]